MSLEALMRPKSVAVVGASGDFHSLGGTLVNYLMNLGFKGKVFPVNPKYETIAGLKCYATASDIPEEVDVALVMVSSKYIFEILEQLRQRQVKAAILFGAGFAEAGAEGQRLQDHLREFAQETGIRICGPNCMGVFNVNESIPLTFSPSVEIGYLPGNLAFVSQSGALLAALSNRAYDKGIGFSHLITGGNEADLEMADYVEFLLEDPGTDAIICLVEGFRNPEKFLKVANTAVRKQKPIVILKTGRTSLGKRCALAHTASIAGSEEVIDAVFKQKGVIRVSDFDELLETGALFARYPKGIDNGLLIMSGSGGAGTFSADLCEELGLRLPDLSSETKQRLLEILPSFVQQASNPLDMTAQITNDPSIFNRCIQLFLNDPNYNVILNILVGPPNKVARTMAMALMDAARKTDKVVTSAIMCGSLASSAFELYKANGVPNFDSPVRCLKAISHLVNYKRFLAQHCDTVCEQISFNTPSAAEVVEIKAKIEAKNRTTLTEYESKQVLSAYGIPVTREGLATSEDEAIELARSIGYPLALKVCSPEIMHKTEAGVVKLGIADDASLTKAYQEIMRNAAKYNPEATVDGILVQEMVPPGIEAIVGVMRDPQFGPAVMFGLGGIFTELLRDVSLRIAPLSRSDIEAMIHGVKGFKLLEGYRGKPRADIDALTEVLLRVSQLCVDLKDTVAELDINPLVVLEEGQGVKAVDALIVTRSLFTEPQRTVVGRS